MFYFDATSELRARETVKIPKERREIRKSSFRSWREKKHLLVFVRMFSSLLPL
jgi:hypothetical protein